MLLIAVAERVLLWLVLTDAVHCRCRILFVIAFVHLSHLITHISIGRRGQGGIDAVRGHTLLGIVLTSEHPHQLIA